VGDQRQNNPQTLRDAGKGLDETAEKLASEWEKLKAESADLDGLFGDGQDDVGGLLRTLYEVVHSVADEAFTSASKNYAAFGEKLRQVGDRDEEIEQFNAEILSRLQAKMEGAEEGRG
jgi:hypothetical protein